MYRIIPRMEIIAIANLQLQKYQQTLHMHNSIQDDF